ncbi:unnamed protein product [Trypanosoma congolense IL3000]|uniref:WGS project CAEQ00000000 data, annotated contig 1049 n=1 Tax=Trypanosoma congolense (strain IL3000) TaxID=1068625 RepID=F9W3G0_TRYCI|nr:unnamed protein product [Trypanosoma congolense IL3000]
MNSSKRPAELAAKAEALDASFSSLSTSFLVLSHSFLTCRNRRPVILHASEPIPLDLDWMNLDCHSSSFISRCVIFAAPSYTCCVAQGVTSFKVLLKVHMAAPALVGMALGVFPVLSTGDHARKTPTSYNHFKRSSIATDLYLIFSVCLPILY